MRHALLALALMACDTPGGSDTKPPEPSCGWCRAEPHGQCWTCEFVDICTPWTHWAWRECPHLIDGLCFNSEGDSLGRCKLETECPADDGPLLETCP